MPTLTPEERHEAYLLLRYFRITWHERQQVYEAWEIENALAFLRAELGVPDTFDDAEPDAKTVEADEGERCPRTYRCCKGAAWRDAARSASRSPATRRTSNARSAKPNTR
jgi:hypothetical protein